MDAPCIVELKEVFKSYKMGKIDVPALRGVDFKCCRGEFIAIVGPSGSGKTTLLNILGCLDVPSAGDVVVHNRLLSKRLNKEKVEIRRKGIGFIFQNFNLLPVLTVYENIEYPLLLLKKPVRERKELVEKAMAEVGLTHRAKHYPNSLSGGEQQRVSIARALVKRPQLILADEPTANLDSETGVKIIELMRKINQEEGLTFVFSTHDSQVLKNVQEIYRLCDGKLDQGEG